MWYKYVFLKCGYCLLGLVLISIGKKVLDFVIGEISFVIGIRSNLEIGLVIFVIMFFGGFRKKKLFLGVLVMLEEELVVRRSFWRR